MTENMQKYVEKNRKYIDKYGIDPERKYSIGEAAAIVDCSEATMRRRCYARHITHNKGVGYRISGVDLIEYIKKTTVVTLFESIYA